MKRKTARRAGLALGGLVLVFGLVLAFVQTGPGARVLARTLSALLSDGPDRVQIRGLSGFIPFSIGVGRVELSDRAGTWLEIERAELSLSPAALLAGRIDIPELKIHRAALDRIPESEGGEPMPWPPDLDPPGLRIGKLDVGELHLAREVGGREADFNLRGGVDFLGPILAAELEARRTGQNRTACLARLSLDRKNSRLEAEIQLEDDGNGPVASMLGLGGEKVEALLKGQGPLFDWKGNFSLQAGVVELARAYFELSDSDLGRSAIKLKCRGELSPWPGLGTAEIRETIGPGAGVDFNLDYGLDSGALRLHDFGLCFRRGTLRGQGVVGPQGERLQAEFQLAVVDGPGLLQGLGLPPDFPVFSRGEAKIALSGRLDRPMFNLNLSLDQPARSDIRAEKLRLDLETGAFEHGEWPLRGRAGLEGLTTGAAALAQPLDPVLVFDLDLGREGEKGEEFWRVQARSARLELQGASLALKGEWSEAGDMNFAGRLDLSDIAPPARAAGLDLAGQASFDLDLSRGSGQGLVFRIKSNQLSLASPPEKGDALSSLLAACLARDPSLRAELVMNEGGAASLSQAVLSSSRIELEAGGGLGPDFEANPLHFQVSLPEAAFLSALAGIDLAGQCEITGELKGSAEKPQVRAEFQARDFRLAGTPLGPVKGEAAMTLAAERLSGRAGISLSPGQTPLALSANYSLAGPDLALDNIKITVPDGTIQGSAGLGLETGLVRGKLKGGLGNLEKLGPLLGFDLSGRMNFTADLAPQGAGQGANLFVDASSLGLQGAEADRLTLEFQTSDLFGLSGAKLKARADKLRAASIQPVRADLSAEGRENEFSWAIALKGKNNSRINTQGRLSRDNTQTLLLVQSLESAGLKPCPKLRGPLRLALAPGRISLDDFELGLGQGSIKARIAVSPDQAQGAISLEGFDISALGLSGLDDLEGTLGGKIIVAGSGKSPELSFNFNLAEFGLENEPLLDLSLAGSAGPTGFKAELLARDHKIQGPPPFRAMAEFPLDFSLAPFRLDLPDQAGLSGFIEADADLDRLTPCLELAGTRIYGRLKGKGTFAGTLDNPTINGDWTITGGGVENGALGLELRDLSADFSGQGKTLTIREIKTTDGQSGSLTMAGKIDIDPENRFPFALGAVMNHLQLVRREDAHLKVTGGLNLQGTTSLVKAWGELHAGPGEVVLPSESGPEITEIEIKGINDQEGGPDKEWTGPKLDLDVPLKLSQINVHGRGLESEWEGDLRLVSPNGAPGVLGRAFARRGRVDLFGKIFDLAKAALVFHGAYPPNPDLDVEARINTGGVAASFILSGPAEDPEFKMTSVPPMEDGEILSRVLFGQSRDSIDPAQALQLAQAASSLLVQGSALDILGQTRRLLSLDELSLKTNKGTVQDASLRAGKRVSDKVMLHLEQGIGPESGKVSVEVELTPEISVESGVKADESGGIELNWKHDY